MDCVTSTYRQSDRTERPSFGPTPGPAQEGNCRRASAVLFPSLERVGMGRFNGRLDLQLLTCIKDRHQRALKMARKRPGVRWVRGEGTHRFASVPLQTSQIGISPVPRRPPYSKTSRRPGQFMKSEFENKMLAFTTSPLEVSRARFPDAERSRSIPGWIALARSAQGCGPEKVREVHSTSPPARRAGGLFHQSRLR